MKDSVGDRIQRWFGRFIRSKAFSILFCVLGLGMIFYLSDKLAMLIHALWEVNIQTVLQIAMLVYFAFMLIFTNDRKLNQKMHKFYHLCCIIFCFIPNMIIFFLLFDIADAIWSWNEESLYLMPFMMAVLITVYGFYHARQVYIKHYDVSYGRTTKNQNKKIVLLSDIHAGGYVDRQQLHKIVEKVNQQKPDMIILAGDTFDQDAFDCYSRESVKKELVSLHAHDGVFAVLGNHDPISFRQDIREFFEDAGIRLIIDEQIETEDFVLIGRDDVLGNPKRKRLGELIEKNTSDKFQIVIDHNPIGIDEAIQNHVDLVLCGHTHKGQFFPATLFTQMTYGKKGNYGHYKTLETHSVVSSGVGYFELPMRLGTNSEIVVLNMVKVESEK